MRAKLRILLADDHELVRDGLALLLNDQPDMTVVGQVGDGLAVLHAAPLLSPDIVLMDVALPSLGGIQATAQLRRICPLAQVVALSRHSEPGYVQQMLKAGAAGYVLKQAASSDLLLAISQRGGGRQLC